MMFTLPGTLSSGSLHGWLTIIRWDFICHHLRGDCPSKEPLPAPFTSHPTPVCSPHTLSFSSFFIVLIYYLLLHLEDIHFMRAGNILVCSLLYPSPLAWYLAHSPCCVSERSLLSAIHALPRHFLKYHKSDRHWHPPRFQLKTQAVNSSQTWP